MLLRFAKSEPAPHFEYVPSQIFLFTSYSEGPEIFCLYPECRGLYNPRLPAGSARLTNNANNKFGFIVAPVDGVTKGDPTAVKNQKPYDHQPASGCKNDNHDHRRILVSWRVLRSVIDTT